MPNDIAKVSTSDRVLDRWVTDRLVEWTTANGTEKTKETLRSEVDAIAVDLAGPCPSPVERVLAESAAVCWFALRITEAHFAGSAAKGGQSIVQSEHCQRRVDRAHRRLMLTLKTLATVRRLDVPTLQVNLAHRQMNVAGPSAAALPR